jgi:hypothetical protein
MLEPFAMASEPQPPSSPRKAGLEPASEPCAVLMHRADYRLVRTLLSIQHRKATGTLRVEAEGVVTIVRMRDGHPVFVEGGLPADSLGRLLVQRGKISESTLAMVEEQRMLLQGRMRFGEVARRLGVLESDVLDDALRDQVRDKLQRCLHWERNQHTFITEDHGVQALSGRTLDVEPLLLAGVARHFSGERVQDVLAPLWRETVRLRAERTHIGERFGFGDFEESMLDQILIAASIGHIMAGPAARNPRVGHVLVALTLCDQVDAPELDAPDESGPFVIEDLARTPRRSIRVSDAPSDTPLSDSIRPPAGAGNDHVPLPGKEKLLADSAFLQGKELLRAGEYGAAADAFREASNLRPSALEYALFAAWSAYLSTGRAGKWRDMLSELCTRTLAQDRHLAFAHHVRGQLALESKDLDTAKNSLLRALELDPQDDEAKRLLDRMKN